MVLYVKNITLICLFVCSAGCAGSRYGAFEPAQATSSPPRYAMLYYPYGPALERGLTKPVPDYSGWPEERMIRDMQRLKRAGVQVVITAVDFEKTADSYRQDQYELFIELLGKHADWPRLAYWITSPGERLSGATRQQLTQWLLVQTARYPEAHFKLEGRPLAVLAPDIKRWPFPHPAITFRMTERYHKQWVWTPPAASPVKLGPNREQCVVFGGWRARGNRSDREWILPRAKGHTLQRGLRKAVPLWTSLICVDSWNDYRNGSFVEPNELDGWKLYSTLQEEIKFLRQTLLLRQKNGR